MLIAFYKKNSDKDCPAEIVKFVDRIWLDKNGNLICIRTFIVHVKNSSFPLHGLRILSPFQQIQELYDLSGTCLDRSYFLNNPKYVKSGIYEIKHSDNENYGLVDYDYFTTQVFTTSLIKSFDSPREPLCKIISIDFKENPIDPGSYRLIRFSFKITSVLDEMFPKLYSLCLDYFKNNTSLDNYNTLNIVELEIPVVKILSKETLQGGFDIFLFLPENFVGTKFNEYAMTTSRQLADGRRTQKPFQKFIWRARKVYTEDRVHYLRAGETPIAVEGLLNDPFELEDIRSGISGLKNDTSMLKIGTKKSRIIALVALFIALGSLIIAHYWKIFDFFKGCFK